MPQHQAIFVNLPVEDLDRSRAFFSGLGYTFDENFCDDNALCLELGPALYAMLLRRDFFDGFHDRRTADTGTVETLLALSVESRAEVDGLADRAAELGGTAVRSEDMGLMYGRSWSDPDGHVWEVMWMDPAFTGDGPEVPDGGTVEIDGAPVAAGRRA
ncbi:VOC family protein [Ornithinimicrobium sp. W1665]|uniref:VOC family protein n=1 Tax=Ornithinimicrobium sp. W1665 TaxID=3416666 RepID=UPI003CF174ED